MRSRPSVHPETTWVRALPPRLAVEVAFVEPLRIVADSRGRVEGPRPLRRGRAGAVKAASEMPACDLWGEIELRLLSAQGVC